MHKQEVIETEISDEAVMEQSPVVSVLMSTYEHEKYIAQAIEGVVKQQTSFPIELIIGEDCSSDGTRQIVMEYQKRYPEIIRVIYSSRNLGAFNNMNRMVKKVRGEFVAWCEGDDYWHSPVKLQKQVDYLREHPSCSLVHSDYDWLVCMFGEWRRIRDRNKKMRKNIPQGEVFSALLITMFVRTCTMMGRTKLVVQHFSSELRSDQNPAGDWAIVLHLAGLGEIGYIEDSLATYRRTQGSMTNTHSYGNYLPLHKKKSFMYKNFSRFFSIEKNEWHEINKTLAHEMVFSAFDSRSKSDFDYAIAALRIYSPDVLSKWRIRMRMLLMKSRVSSFVSVRINGFLRELSLYRRSQKDALGKNNANIV